MFRFSIQVPLFVPVLVLSVVAGLILARPIARRLATTRWVAFLLVASLGLIVGATLTPLLDALEGVPSDGICDTSRQGWADLATYTRINSSSLNVALFVPLGVALALLPWNRATAALVVGSLFLPIVVELTQLLLPVLGRGCQTADIVDNTTGLVLGLAAGYLAKRVLGPGRS
jgi:hypothetical protein